VAKVLLVICFAVMATAFAMDNMHHVDLGLVLGKPVHVRLFFLLMTSFLIGSFSAMLVNLCLNTRPKEPNEKAPDSVEDDDFFSA
jgi:uncharacterized integral membrane protein